MTYLHWAVILGQLGVAQVGKGSQADFLKEYQRQEKEIVSKLQDAKLWSDPKQKDALLEHLAVARLLRSKALVPVLIPHLTYSQFKEGGAYKTVEERYPAMWVLLEIGTPAIPALVEVLKKADPDDDPLKNAVLERKGSGTGAAEHGVALHCIVGIYNQGGYGKDLAKARIELELKAATKDLEKMFLRRALENGIFKQ